MDGNFDVTAIRRSLEHAIHHTGQPVLINIRTTVGIGTSLAGSSQARRSAFGEKDIMNCKTSWGFDPAQTHFIPDDVREYWSEVPLNGKKEVSEWNFLLQKYSDEYSDLAKEFQATIRGDIDLSWKDELLNFKPAAEDMPIRLASAKVFDILWKKLPLFGGSADLSEPNRTLLERKGLFGSQNPHSSFSGRYVHFGVREHGMVAIANGMAAYSPGSFIPVTATMSMFQLYAAAAIRMSAINKLHVIHIGTHDSIGEGSNGPTHQVRRLIIRGELLMMTVFQPVELPSLFRSTPFVLHIRPADAEEAVVCSGSYELVQYRNGAS